MKLAYAIGISAACRHLGISEDRIQRAPCSALCQGEIRGVQPGKTPEQSVERFIGENKGLHEENDILAIGNVISRARKIIKP